jgi:acyl-CoA thioesterase I
MNSAIFHFVGGDAFFTGFLSVAVGAFMKTASQGKRHRMGAAAMLFGWILVVASATAVPIPVYAIAATLSVFAVATRPHHSVSDANGSTSEADAPSERLRFRPGMCRVLCIVALGAMLNEFTGYHQGHVRVPTGRPVFVIGDSLSAGINDGVDVPWPKRLDEITSPKVSNQAQAGATCRSALKQMDGLPVQCVVIVEIGGNDLLGGRSASEFRADLNSLLSKLKTPDRDVVMFELPLPPLFNGYGYAQRELAAQYSVALIPRRLLASVLFGQNATLDSIHLSNDGHQRLAERVADILSLGRPQ